MKDRKNIKTFDKSAYITCLSFYALLTDRQKEVILDNSEIQSFSAGEIISGMQDEKTGPFLILTGTVRAIMDDENFREVTLFRLQPYELGLLSAPCLSDYITFDVKFAVEEDSTLLVVRTGILKKIIEKNLAVRCAVFETLTERFSSCMENVYELLFTRYESRMAAFLIERYLCTGKTEISLTQETIAKMTGSVREVAGRTIRRLAQDGILEYGRGKVTIIDIDKLKELTKR